MRKTVIFSFVVSLLWIWVSLMFWASYAAVNPINEILLELFAKKGHSTIYSISIHASDFITMLFIALPFAALIKLLAFSRAKLALLIVVGVAFIYNIVTPYWSKELLVSWLFWWCAASHSIAIPVAYILLSKVQATGNLKFA